MAAKNTLFVCRNNIARSRLGAGYYNLWHPGHGFSAGTDVDVRGQLVEDWDDPEVEKFIWLAADDGIEIAKTERTPLDEKSLKKIGRVILMDPAAVKELEERRSQPLPFPNNVEVWDLPDPHHMSREDSIDIRKIIKAKVAELATRSMMPGSERLSSEAYMPSNF